MLRKIADLPKPCLNPQHNPPSMMYLSPGVYEHTCPGCGTKMIFTVGGVYMSCEPPTVTIGKSDEVYSCKWDIKCTSMNVMNTNVMGPFETRTKYTV